METAKKRISGFALTSSAVTILTRQYKMPTADFRPGTKCRLQTRYKGARSVVNPNINTRDMS